MSKKKKSEAWGENGFEDWGGYMAAKQAKLEEQFLNEATNEVKSSNIFQGIAIFVNGYTNPTADELRRLMMIHGGIYHNYMRPRVTTHIIATNLPYSKVIMYRKSQNPTPICKPEWITDSIKAGRILNFQKYLLYSQCTSVQPQLMYTVEIKENKTNSIDQVHNNIQTDHKVNIPKSNKGDKLEAVEDSFVNQVISNPTTSISSRDARSTKNSEFISEFYSHSRLHHIATMGATFKDYVNHLRDKSNGKFLGLDKLKELRDKKLNSSLTDSQLNLSIEADFQGEDKTEVSQGPIIMHIDMDCFFVSVGLRDKPEFRGLPVAVTHAKGNKNPANNKQILDSNTNRDEEHGSLSEIASCSYEARKAGVKNGMFLGEALKICPNLKPIPYDFEGYTEVSYTLYDTVASYTLDIEAVSCDEMYADCTKILEELCLTPLEFAAVIRKEIKDKTGCPVSTGFGSNKLLARLATRKAKPNGQFYIQQQHINDCINTFNVEDLPGVGWTTGHKLKNMNVRTCAELQAISLTTVQKEFGKKMGEMLYNMCRGKDNSKLNLEHVRKSVSAEVNYGIRFQSNEDAIDFLRKLSHEVCNRLNKANAKGRCITLKVLVRAKEAPKETEKFMGHGLCDYVTKSKNLISAINDVDIMTKEVIALWNQMQKVPEDARGIGIQISRLEILKNKSRGITLTSFVNKKKENSSTSGRSIEEKQAANEARSSANSNAVASVSGNNKIAENRKTSNVPPGINESVLSELPEDIRNELLVVNGTEQLTEQGRTKEEVQTRQENFFKQTKPGVSRPTKVEMPPIQEIDMSVLIELPEDIRNEILNEYSAKKKSDETSVNRNENNMQARTSSTSGTSSTTEDNRDEENISFSQVDPEFLAALSEDLRRDVQTYCTAKKAEYSSKVKKNESKVGWPKGEHVKQNRKVEVNSKSKNSKATLAKHKKKNVQAALKTTKNTNEPKNSLDKKIDNARSIIPSVEEMKSVKNEITEDEAEAILSHNRTISQDNGSVIQQENSLIDLVNRLLNLPLDQVKMHMQIWIANSKIVNEVDFLSLATFLSMLPEKKRIEDLHVLLKTMHRCMTKTGNCIWHRTYRKTVKYVQHYMQIEYNSNLMVPPIKCNLLQCNSDVM
ncbi:DNA repair protein REV1 [Habropoda laboriosa]|uniref:DNA repair protein REV1 n=1 Tax=Habropoda laboriosa TaxID=597456 RepID=A0A0L7R6C0_9HYME|nr:PREDICTED: DNA repair protein REV1 [Habropoda laboriosa]KOC66420.1 DNA repair protein REV1 [Habropoda laboriosa]